MRGELTHLLEPFTSAAAGRSRRGVRQRKQRCSGRAGARRMPSQAACVGARRLNRSADRRCSAALGACCMAPLPTTAQEGARSGRRGRFGRVHCAAMTSSRRTLVRGRRVFNSGLLES